MQSKKAITILRRRVSELLQAVRSLIRELSRCTEEVKSSKRAVVAGTSPADPHQQLVGPQRSGSRSGGGSGQLFAAEIASMTDTLSLGEIQDLLMGGEAPGGGPRDVGGTVMGGAGFGSAASLERKVAATIQQLVEAAGSDVELQERAVGGTGTRREEAPRWDLALLDSVIVQAAREVDVAIGLL